MTLTPEHVRASWCLSVDVDEAEVYPGWPAERSSSFAWPGSAEFSSPEQRVDRGLISL